MESVYLLAQEGGAGGHIGAAPEDIHCVLSVPSQLCYLSTSVNWAVSLCPISQDCDTQMR